MRCPYCGSELEAGALFCGECGKKVEAGIQKEQRVFCQFCGTCNETGAVFCEGCGKKLSGGADIGYESAGYDDTAFALDEAEDEEKAGGGSGKRVRSIVILVAVVLALAGGGIGGYMIVRTQQKKAAEAVRTALAEEDEKEAKEKEKEEKEKEKREKEKQDQAEEEKRKNEEEKKKKAEEEEKKKEEEANRQYIIPDSNTKNLTSQDIDGLSAKDLNYARNEIYARHGRTFKSRELQSYFDSKSWYKGTISPSEFDSKYSGSLSSVEKANAEFLKKAESALGGYTLDK